MFSEALNELLVDDRITEQGSVTIVTFRGWGITQHNAHTFELDLIAFRASCRERGVERIIFDFSGVQEFDVAAIAPLAKFRASFGGSGGRDALVCNLSTDAAEVFTWGCWRRKFRRFETLDDALRVSRRNAPPVRRRDQAA